ncbi:MAG: A/G-specific adenine glycosylase [Bacteroidia bacterium]
MDFAAILLKWYRQHKRDLPWRTTRDPYPVWLSEVILQQTRVDQGMSYYHKFLDAFPDIRSLALAPEEKIMKLWQGLGYYSRARNLHNTARIIASEYQGKFPGTYEELLRLKGIGPYTAAAISSFCFDEAHPVIDGNVYRVLSRIFGIETAIDSTAGKKALQELAKELISHKYPGIYNQAIMEFGAIWCTPKKPKCETCPFRLHCEAFRTNRTDQLPVKSKKTAVSNRYFYYLHISCGKQIILHKRTERDIWQHLHDFPLIETPKPVAVRSLKTHQEWKRLLAGQPYTITHITDEVIHKLSHRNLHIVFIGIQVKNIKKIELPEYHFIIPQNLIKEYSFPIVIARYLEKKGV